MPGKRTFEDQLAALDALHQLPPEARIEPLRKALAHRNNFVVAKAADLVRQSELTQLTPDLLTAFDRFMLSSGKDDPIKTDPQCWAKNALSRALAAFEHQDAGLFLRGMKHIQLEPSYGGPSDSAATLPATCALALVQCRSLLEPELLSHLIELIDDKDKSVRVEAIRAIEQVNSPSAALLLRQRAIISPLLNSKLQDDEPEALGACYTGILRIEGASAIPWVAQFLAQEDDSAAEAALAIAGTHSTQAFEVLRGRFTHAADPWFCSVLLSSMALTRQDAALEFLLDQVRFPPLRTRHQSPPSLRPFRRSHQAIERTGGPQPPPLPRLREIKLHTLILAILHRCHPERSRSSGGAKDLPHLRSVAQARERRMELSLHSRLILFG
jgi:HEAT repeat protein